MSFFISDAMAEAAPAVQQPEYAPMLFMVGILVFFYLLILRPQSKKQKEHKKMLEALTKGVEIVTNGGLLGKVVDVDENFVRVEVADNTILHVQRHAIANVMPKGTVKAQNKKSNT